MATLSSSILEMKLEHLFLSRLFIVGSMRLVYENVRILGFTITTNSLFRLILERFSKVGFASWTLTLILWNGTITANVDIWVNILYHRHADDHPSSKDRVHNIVTLDGNVTFPTHIDYCSNFPTCLFNPQVEILWNSSDSNTFPFNITVTNLVVPSNLFKYSLVRVFNFECSSSNLVASVQYSYQTQQFLGGTLSVRTNPCVVRMGNIGV
jgi:hypothetical protein